MDRRSEVTGRKQILIGLSDTPGKGVPGCYFQGRNGLITGGYNYFGPNVGVISANHNKYNLTKAVSGRPILIGVYNWIGFGVVILPEVKIGDHVIIGANSVVTKDIPSFSIFAGNPAIRIGDIDPDMVTKYKDMYEMYGYYTKESKKGRELAKIRKLKLQEYITNYGSILSESLMSELRNNE